MTTEISDSRLPAWGGVGGNHDSSQCFGTIYCADMTVVPAPAALPLFAASLGTMEVAGWAKEKDDLIGKPGLEIDAGQESLHFLQMTQGNRDFGTCWPPSTALGLAKGSNLRKHRI